MTQSGRYFLTALMLISMPMLDAADSKPLTQGEKYLLHAAVVLIRDPDIKNLAEKAAESAKDPEWKYGDDPALIVIAAIEQQDDLRELYRKSLKQQLADDPRGNVKKLMERLKSDFTERKLEKYRTFIRNNAKLGERPQEFVAKDAEKSSLPWPLCIPFHCCD